MAIAEMKKFRLIGLDSDRAEIMNVLSESGVFESYPTTETEGTVAASSVSPESFLTERARVAAAIDGVSAALNENPYADTSRANKSSYEIVTSASCFFSAKFSFSNTSI